MNPDFALAPTCGRMWGVFIVLGLCLVATVVITAATPSSAQLQRHGPREKGYRDEKDRPRTDRWSIRCCGQHHRCQRGSSH
jgi:hypothetical protein